MHSARDEAVKRRLVQAVVQDKVRSMLMRTRSWLLARAAAEDRELCAVVVQEARAAVCAALVHLLASPGALSQASYVQATRTFNGVCVLGGVLSLLSFFFAAPHNSESFGAAGPGACGLGRAALCV